MGKEFVQCLCNDWYLTIEQSFKGNSQKEDSRMMAFSKEHGETSFKKPKRFILGFVDNKKVGVIPNDIFL